MSLDSGTSNDEEGLLPPPCSVGRAQGSGFVWRICFIHRCPRRREMTRVATPGVRRGGRRSGSRRVAVAYQDADQDPSSTAVSNRLRVAFSPAVLTVVFMEEALRSKVKVTHGPAPASQAAVSALSLPETPTCPGTQ